MTVDLGLAIIMFFFSLLGFMTIWGGGCVNRPQIEEVKFRGFVILGAGFVFLISHLVSLIPS